ncbi:hypothetical protein [Agromyces archimandritae]|uniref:Uncharacterized protein n=1 Tax=Agromyces archimandritae TaxID=2781962 RepID=A0A975IMQ4_9MICO|nr:hypothetical protein [Agromyces archimandritae]QTX03758.1 hypothetical protein G127AT_10525 [Agromyces archimandritae]
MPDFMDELPLSRRGRVDESGVHSDRRLEYAEVLEQTAALRSDAGEPDAGEAARLHTLAADARGGRRVPVRILARAVLEYLELAREASAPAELASGTSGAVALFLAAKAPTEIRAVIGGHALRASDAGWEFGRGPVLEAPAADLIRFLAGRSDTAPRPAAPRNGGTPGA